jgi:hypothetical protein
LPPCISAATAAFALLATPALAGYADDVGYTRLRAELGASAPDGGGVVVSQVEAAVTVNGADSWVPDVNEPEFAGKTIVDRSGGAVGVYSSHATGVGQSFYGLIESTSPGITIIDSFWAIGWLGADYLWATGGRQPASNTSRIVNHSWVGNGTSINAEVMARTDWIVEVDDAVVVAGMNNGTGNPNTSPLMGNGFNVIAVGRTSGNHQVGSYAVDSTYTGTRVKPDLVAPIYSTSRAAPSVASIAALLIETGGANAALSTDPVTRSFVNRSALTIRNAARVEVVRAALMAGADRVTHNSSSPDLPVYRGTAGDQTANGLDRRFGAGQVNAYNSYHIIAAAEQNSGEDGGPGAGTLGRGFDYDPAFGGSAGSNVTATYALPVASTPQLLTAALVWNLDIAGGSFSNFNGSATFRDLNLTVLDVATPSNPVTIATSASTTDNTEHAWLVIPAGAAYALRVSRVPATNFSYDFGIAWQLLPDADGDGAHDDQDNCVNAANGPILRDAGGNRQRDTNGDGYGNLCDADLNNNGIVNAADLGLFRARFGTPDPDADFNGDGVVNAVDLGIMRNLFGRAPGPSAIAP